MADSHQVSFQAQLELNDVQESSFCPGPGSYFQTKDSTKIVSSFGEQTISKCASAPQFSVAHTTFDDWSGVFISKGHEKNFKGKDSPLPGKYDVSVPLSKLGAKIGSSERPDLAKSLGIDPNGSPGPAMYPCVRDTFGKSSIVSPNKNDPVKGGFGLSQRFPSHENRKPGPPEYFKVADGEPTKTFAFSGETGRSFGVGRAAYDKVVRPGWEKEGQCKLSPGVGPPMRRDFSSEAMRWHGGGRRSHSIGNQQRFGKDGDGGPGPGAYDRNEFDMSGKSRSMVSRQQMSLAASDQSEAKAKKPVGTFGKAPSKPRFRTQLAMNTGKHGCWGYH